MAATYFINTLKITDWKSSFINGISEKNQMERLELKTEIITVNLIVDFNILLYIAKGRISKLKYRSLKNIRAKRQR